MRPAATAAGGYVCVLEFAAESEVELIAIAAAANEIELFLLRMTHSTRLVVTENSPDCMLLPTMTWINGIQPYVYPYPYPCLSFWWWHDTLACTTSLMINGIHVHQQLHMYVPVYVC